jgi:hypothetical protein
VADRHLPGGGDGDGHLRRRGNPRPAAATAGGTAAQRDDRAIGATGTTMFFLSTHHGLLAITAVITALYPAVTILLARVASGERLTGLRIIGLTLAAASVALIAAGGAG